MILGQSAGTAAAMAIDAGCAVQDVNGVKLREQLLAGGQVLQWNEAEAKDNRGVDAASLPGIVVDDSDANVHKAGVWRVGYVTPRYVNGGYSISEPGNPSDAAMTYTLPIQQAGVYELRLSYPPHPNRSEKVNIEIAHAGGTVVKTINQRKKPPLDGLFVSLGTYRLEPGKPATVTLRNGGTVGYVIADAVQALKQRPNVIILFTDDQGTLDANCYGSTDLHTPHIDKLAATGVRFTQAYAHTVCCPARAMLLTGRHPQRSGVSFWTQGDMNAAKGINMALEEVTLAEALKSAGYRTALYGKWHLGAHRDYGPKKQGFDEFFGIRDGFIDNYNHHFLHGAGFHDLYEGTTPVQAAAAKYFPEMMVHRALRFIDENKDRPFFLYVPFNIPHYPEQALKRFEAKYADMKDDARRSYGAIVSTTDHYIGQIIDKLEANGLRDNTIVIFMSDNGHSEETGNKIRVDNHKSGLPRGHFYGASGGGNTGKWLGQKGSFLEGGIRVPAIISYPAELPTGVVRDQAVTAMDWMPTILDLCNVALPDVELDGSSLVPIIESATAKSPYEVLHWQWGNRWAVREGEWKLLGQDGEARSLGNLNDPQPETKDYLKEEPELVARLLALHNEWAKDVQPKHGLETK